MRISVFPALIAAVALSGCVVVPPTGTTPGVVAPPVVVTPPAAPPQNAVARQVINAEMARRLPGRNVAPLTDCVVANATMAELSDIAAQQGQAGAAGAVAAIVGRPATSQCIARAAVA